MTAMKKGWWLEGLKKFGVKKVTEYEFPSGPPEMTAMMAGELDIAYVGATPPITAIDKGLDAKIVAGVQIQGSALALKTGITYTSPEDLKGLTIATFPPGSIQDTVLRKWLIDNGINPDTDLEISPMGPGEAVSALEAGAVDGVFLPHPGPAIVELEGKGVMVIQSGTMWPNHACCVLLVSGLLIREFPEMVKEIVRIHIKATKYNMDHPDEAAQIYAERVGWDVEDTLYSLDTWDGEWVHDPHIGLNVTLEYCQVHYDLGYTEKLLTEEDLFDTSFYDEVITEFS
jgi:NitT/TauT family transport system substrate-binding protein